MGLVAIGGMTAQDNISLELDKNSLVVIPKDADFSDTEASLSYDLDENAPDNAIARILSNMTAIQLDKSIYALQARQDT